MVLTLTPIVSYSHLSPLAFIRCLDLSLYRSFHMFWRKPPKSVFKATVSHNCHRAILDAAKLTDKEFYFLPCGSFFQPIISVNRHRMWLPKFWILFLKPNSQPDLFGAYSFHGSSRQPTAYWSPCGIIFCELPTIQTYFVKEPTWHRLLREPA